MITEKDKKMRKGIINTLEQFKVPMVDWDEIVFFIMTDIKIIYLNEEL